ncbi:hypothetical protein [Sphingomonas xinjiangensis]|uniref:Uncharacterized protein n=1 Tax=Sphingomonas xinjiangensis TaxID=643568 RepID=A0A840YJ28_9SPHN|nr:hypothetical protein [Sphingomonas xinjiangensis]MBB5712129.1 hypothetical protein [Sphingomonas xinjiangensis]
MTRIVLLIRDANASQSAEVYESHDAAVMALENHAVARLTANGSPHKYRQEAVATYFASEDTEYAIIEGGRHVPLGPADAGGLFRGVN